LAVAGPAKGITRTTATTVRKESKSAQPSKGQTKVLHRATLPGGPWRPGCRVPGFTACVTPAAGIITFDLGSEGNRLLISIAHTPVKLDKLTYWWEWQCTAGEDISECKSTLAGIRPLALPPQEKNGYWDLFAAVGISP
jgi:hypothetical protein